MARVGDIKTAWVGEELVLGKRERDREEVFIRWLCPREGWLKLNTDGATKGTGQVGCGGIIRGHRRELFEMFAARCGVCSSVQEELLGVLRGLAVAWNAGHSRVQLNVDSEVVVQLLTNTTVPNSPMFHTIRRCRSMVQRSGWEVSVIHCYREVNRAADWLANYGVTLEQKMVLLEATPLGLRRILLEDLGGATIAHRVPALAA